ncbi:uncharacterized protein A1O5_04343 [Cladophialophora psammophila CBS 110553]|uniref:Uncharacterized protein n=1 Tax=Cladophialophora psammophila CBS 110553 TaxID=1182543 RepID=W9WUK4_9EURO|nr:uncharacterized protein A1O5_04343 [Cladophialophora psammophila CBS 110553]EXJ71842.1 hypothetical protein A1O5_04343 [Cladophialophora psammophila CBS 110553]
MTSFGGHDAHVYGDETNVRQKPGPQDNWQESVVLAWWDNNVSVGGFQRIGHEPNNPEGAAVELWNNITAPNGTFHKVVNNPLRKEDCPDNGGLGGGDDTLSFEFQEGKHIWNFEEPELSGQLVHVDVGPNIDSFPKKEGIGSDLGAAHFDIPGRVTGWLKVKGQGYKIDGLSIRDHGWGPRSLPPMLSHRWLVGTCGRQFSFIAIAFHSMAAEHHIGRFGWVIRNGEVTYGEKVDMVAYVEVDGATNRGGHLKYTLTTGEVVDIECKAVPAKAFVCFKEGVCCLDRICTFTSGEHKGFMMFETSHNIQHGTRRPITWHNSVIDDGWTDTGVID